MFDIILLLRKSLGFIIVCLVVVSLFTFVSFKHYKLQSTIDQLQNEKVIMEQSREIEKQRVIREMTSLSDKYKQEANEREKYYAQQYQEILINYESTQSSVDGLFTTTSEIRDNVRSPNVTRETVVKYVDRYETVFKECVNEYTEVATDADKLVLMNNSLNKEIESFYTLLEEYQQKNPTNSSD